MIKACKAARQDLHSTHLRWTNMCALSSKWDNINNKNPFWCPKHNGGNCCELSDSVDCCIWWGNNIIYLNIVFFNISRTKMLDLWIQTCSAMVTIAWKSNGRNKKTLNKSSNSNGGFPINSPEPVCTANLPNIRKCSNNSETCGAWLFLFQHNSDCSLMRSPFQGNQGLSFVQSFVEILFFASEHLQELKLFFCTSGSM